MDFQLRERVAFEAELRQAIGAGEIVPFFQPLIDLQDGRLIGFEVLARWRHPARGTIGPDQFIPLAEEIGLISDLTAVILRAACRSAADWDPSLTIAVNISPSQLKDHALEQMILGVLAETGFPPHRLEIEITENALVGDFATARRVIESLKYHGVQIALDDFGSGYSSLSHLSELPFDRIKIDRSFVQGIEVRPESLTIVSTIIGLGGSLGIPSTAEGIETPEQATRLFALGCDLGQGFHFSRPVPVEAVASLIASLGQTPLQRGAA